MLHLVMVIAVYNVPVNGYMVHSGFRTYATKYFPFCNILNTLHTVSFVYEQSIYETGIIVIPLLLRMYVKIIHEL